MEWTVVVVIEAMDRLNRFEVRCRLRPAAIDTGTALVANLRLDLGEPDQTATRFGQHISPDFLGLVVVLGV